MKPSLNLAPTLEGMDVTIEVKLAELNGRTAVAK